jgi:cell division protein FtsB
MHATSGDDTCVERPAIVRRRRQGRWIGWLLIFLSCALLLDGLLGDHGLARTLQARQQLRLAAESVQRLKQENAALRDEAHRLRADPATLEAAARRELGLIRPGEILVVVKDLQ